MGFFSDRTTEGTDLTPIRDSLLNVSVDIAELDYAQGLNADSSDNIWVDPFVDSSKIVSSQNVNITTGQNGDITLTKKMGSTLTETLGTDAGTTSYGYGIEINPNKDLIGVKVFVDSDNSGISEVILTDSTGTVLTRTSASAGETVTLNPSNSLKEGNNYAVVTWNDGNDYTYFDNKNINYPVTSTHFDVSNGALVQYIDSENVRYNTYSDFWASISEITALESFSSSGTVTTTTIDKGYTPSALQPDMDVETDSDTSVDIRAFDGNGNEQTWTEQELGQSKSVNFSSSNFQFELQPQTSNSSKTPQINDVGTNVIQ